MTDEPSYHFMLRRGNYVFVVILVPYKSLIHEHEKNQIMSHACALHLFLFSTFRIPTSRRGADLDPCGLEAQFLTPLC